MHFSTLASVALAATAVTAQAPSICDKYTMALLKDNTAANQYTLLSLLVNTAGLGNFTGPGTMHPTLPGSMVKVDGILAPGMVNGEPVNLLPYFTGALKSSNRNNMPTAVNFIDGGGADYVMANPTKAGMEGSNQYMLFTHLYSYFGKLLGCSHYDSMGFPAYMGAASQYNVHKYMNLDHAQNMWFIQQVGLAAKSFGASDADVMTVATSLTNAFNYKCSPATELIPGQGAQLQSICQNSTCPLDPKSTCAAYPANGAAVNPAVVSSSSSAVSQISDKQPQAPTSAAAVTQISDKQPQAPTMAPSAPAVSQIGDKQPQAATSAAAAGVAAATPAQSTPKYTGAAVANSVPGAVAGVAGLVALML